MCDLLLTKAAMYNTMVDGRRFIDALGPSSFPAFHVAIISEVIKFVRLFLAYNVSLVFGNGCTALHFAVHFDSLDTTKAILESFPREELDSVEFQHGLTALRIAVRKNQPKQLVLLLEAGADVNKTGTDGKSALFDAIEGAGGLVMVKLVVKHGADVNQLDSAGSSVLQLAASISASDIVSYLLAQGANADVVGTRWNKPAWQLGCSSAFFEYGYCHLNIDQLTLPVNDLENISELKKTSELDINMDSALQVSLARESQQLKTFLLPSFQLMCSQGCMVNLTALEQFIVNSCSKNSMNLVLGLFEARDQVLSSQPIKEVAMLTALKARRFTLFKKLIDHFSFEICESQSSLVHNVIADSAVQPDDKVAIINFLINDMNCEIGNVNAQGNTPLILACKLPPDIKVFEALIDNGAGARSKDNDDTLPLHTMIEPCNKADEDRVCAIVSLLLDHGAEATAATEDEETASLLAAKKGLIKIVTVIERHNVQEKRKFKKEMGELLVKAMSAHSIIAIAYIAAKLLKN